MAVVRHFVVKLVRADKDDKRSIKLRRKVDSWDQSYLAALLNSRLRQPGFGALVLVRGYRILLEAWPSSDGERRRIDGGPAARPRRIRHASNL
jgi:hypothetical protein